MKLHHFASLIINCHRFIRCLNKNTVTYWTCPSRRRHILSWNVKFVFIYTGIFKGEKKWTKFKEAAWFSKCDLVTDLAILAADWTGLTSFLYHYVQSNQYVPKAKIWKTPHVYSLLRWSLSSTLQYAKWAVCDMNTLHKCRILDLDFT
jgi:hypothetical protein